MSEFFDWFVHLIEPLLPKKFDRNEGFTIFITILICGWGYILMKVRRTLNRVEVVGVLLFNLLYTTVGDYFLAMPPYDYYDTVDRNSGEFSDILLQNLVYPTTLFILIHYYVRYTINKVGFIIGGTLILTMLEWVSVHYFNLFTYKQWNLGLSSLFYFGVMVLNILFYTLFHRYVRKQQKRGRISSST
ncbi:hypothetical protein Q73_00595 [Bacillus coahuilensis m2-6]|nr:hypothetical protein [Bacillus coahuilensis]KUP09909.1 hypothetical protein Q73_00595 [Bacillus coahuilensis m2-6]